MSRARTPAAEPRSPGSSGAAGRLARVLERPRSSPARRQIGPVGTGTRVAGGLAAIMLPVALDGITWWDVGAALVALPLIAAATSAIVDVPSRRHDAYPTRASALEPWIRSAVVLAVIIALTFVTPLNGGTPIWIFIGISLFVAAIRGDAGCEVVAIPNAIFGRRESRGCIVYFPIDAAEARHRVSHAESFGGVGRQQLRRDVARSRR